MTRTEIKRMLIDEALDVVRGILQREHPEANVERILARLEGTFAALPGMPAAIEQVRAEGRDRTEAVRKWRDKIEPMFRAALADGAS